MVGRDQRRMKLRMKMTHLVMVPAVRGQIGRQANERHRSLERPLTLSAVLCAIFPKELDFLPARRAFGVLVEDYRALGRVKVIAECEATDTDGNLFSLEDHGLVRVVRNLHLNTWVRVRVRVSA